MIQDFPARVEEFLRIANRNKVKMIMVGGGAVNFYGYQRHSADVDFWIDTASQNLQNLIKTLREMNFEIQELPEPVLQGEQNISVKLSPVFELELITKFNPGKSFNEAFEDSKAVKVDDIIYHVIGFDDLIRSKITSDRIKDKMDIEEFNVFA